MAIGTGTGSNSGSIGTGGQHSGSAGNATGNSGSIGGVGSLGGNTGQGGSFVSGGNNSYGGGEQGYTPSQPDTSQASQPQTSVQSFQQQSDEQSRESAASSMAALPRSEQRRKREKLEAKMVSPDVKSSTDGQLASGSSPEEAEQIQTESQNQLNQKDQQVRGAQAGQGSKRRGGLGRSPLPGPTYLQQANNERADNRRQAENRSPVDRMVSGQTPAAASVKKASSRPNEFIPSERRADTTLNGLQPITPPQYEPVQEPTMEDRVKRIVEEAPESFYAPNANDAGFNEYVARINDALLHDGRMAASDPSDDYDAFETMLRQNWETHTSSMEDNSQIVNDEIDMLQDSMKKEYAAIDANKAAWHTDLVFESQRFNPETGRIEYSEEVEAAMKSIAKLYGLDWYEDRKDIFDLVRLATGLGADADGLLWGAKLDKVKLSDDKMVDAAYLIAMSQRQYGHPLGFTRANLEVTWAYKEGERMKGYRWPVGCMPTSLAEKLTNSANSLLRGLTPAKLQDMVLDTWTDKENGTLARLMANSAATGDTRQLGAIEQMVMAYAERQGKEPNDFGVSEYKLQRLSNMATVGRNFEEFTGDDAARDAWTKRNEDAMKSINDLANRKNSRDDVVKKLDQMAINGLAVIRGARIFGEIPLLVTGEVEHFINNREIQLANWLLRTSDDYKMDERLSEAATSTEFLEAIAVISTIREQAGWDGVQAFLASGYAPTKANAAAWATKSGIMTPKGKLAETLNGVFSLWMPGDFGFAKSDAKLFVNCLLANESIRGGLTTEDITTALEANPIAFISEVMQTAEGKDAFVSSKALYAGRISPIPELIKGLMKTNGITDAGVALILDSPYVHYGIKAFELWFPASNTISLALAKKLGTMENGKFKWMAENAVGGSMDTMRRAVVYDSIKFCQNGLTMLFMYTLIQSLGGIEPPDDEDKWYLPWEWMIKDPMSGEYKPLKQQWFMDDLIQWAGVGAMALSYKNKTGDIAGAGRMFMNGINDIFGSNQVVKIAGGLLDMPLACIDLARYLGNGGGELTDEYSRLQDLYTNVTALTNPLSFVKKITKTCNGITPMIVSETYPWFWDDDYARDARYTKDGEYRDSEFQRAINQYAINNPFVAMLANTVWGVKGFVGGKGTEGFTKFGRDNSGLKYVGDEDARKRTELNSISSWLNADAADREDLAGMSKEAITNMYCEYTLNRIKEYGSAEEAAKNGFTIDSDSAYAMKTYINNQVSGIFDQIRDWSYAYRDGDCDYITKDKYVSALYQDYYALKEQLNDIAYEGLVYDKDVYIEVAGTMVQNPETGEWYNYGNRKGDEVFSPFFSPQSKTPGEPHMEGFFDTEIGNDFQTNRYDETADSSSTMATSGARNLVANKDNKTIGALKESVKTDEEMWEAVLAEIKSSSQRTTNGTSGGRSYGYSGGGSGGASGKTYSPNIYSYSKNVNVPRASTMYSKTPYNTNNRYLSPTVFTTGSRNAYSKREG